MRKPWEADWNTDKDGRLISSDKAVNVGYVFAATVYEEAVAEPEDARLAAAAPMLARALCLVEWEGDSGCPACDGYDDNGSLHTVDCPVDAALTAAGLTQEDRVAVRIHATEQRRLAPPNGGVG